MLVAVHGAAVFIALLVVVVIVEGGWSGAMAVALVLQRGGGRRLVVQVSHDVALKAEAGLGLEGPVEGAVERGGAAYDAQDRVLVQLQQVARLLAHHVRRAAGAGGRLVACGADAGSGVLRSQNARDRRASPRHLPSGRFPYN